MTRRLLSLLLVFSACAALAAAPGGGGGSARLERTDGSSWTIRYEAPSFPMATVMIGGVPYRTFPGVSDTSLGEGGPAVPVDVVLLGIPAGAQASVEVRDAQYQVEPDQLLAPAPTPVLKSDGTAAFPRIPRGPAYAVDRLLPEVDAMVGPVFRFRGQTVCPIRLYPCRYQPSARTLRRLVRATLVVRLAHEASAFPARVEARSDPATEGALKGLLLNYDQARAWRSGSSVAGLAKPAADSSRDWFDPALPYVKLPIAADGWYRVPQSVLAGVAPGVDLASSRLFQKGREIPGVVEGDSVLAFYALRQHGDSSDYDFFTDTSVVWLTWGIAPGARYASTSPPAGPVSVVTSAPCALHLEQNTDYFVGAGYDEVTQTKDVPGEGWMWEYYYPGSVLSHGFTMDYLDTSVVKTASVAARLWGTTTHAATPDHDARLLMNDSTAGDVTFNGREGAWPAFTIPARWLRNGTNALKIQSVPTGASVNQFALDWFSVTYERSLRAAGNRLVFPAAAAGTTIRRWRVTGFTDSTISVFDLGRGRMIAADSIVLESGTFTVVFRDTASIPTRYCAVARAGALRDARPVVKTMTNLRALPGADYIVLTHPVFRASAERLAAQRHTTRGIRSVVVDVNDVYDEFNFGIVHPNAIKAFLRFAYASWPSPAPAHVVLVGDASWDPHRYLARTVSVNYIPSFGVPPSDIWYACFDSTFDFIPSMFIGRLPFETVAEGERTVDKLIAFESTPRGMWNKTALMMTDGDTPAEKTDFNAKSDNLFSSSLGPPPLGMLARKAYKTTDAVIDGSLKPFLKETVKNGVGLINFIGHSGGRFWGLDIGSPDELENTNGWWPFVASVSCNVGAFAEPSGRVLAEDFLLADGRGASAVWASASLGYPAHGSLLVSFLFGQLASSSERRLGSLTTSSRVMLWTATGNGYITIAHQFLTPLIGDPLTEFALPATPDLAVQASDISSLPVEPTTLDTSIAVGVVVRNYGIVPGVPAALTLTDTYRGVSSAIAAGVTVPPMLQADSLTIGWHPGNAAGLHSLAATVALPDSVVEWSKSNNAATIDKYIYTNALQAIKPVPGIEVAPGPVRLLVAVRPGGLTPADRFVFEYDTAATFASPFHQVSPEIAPAVLSGSWITPSLPGGVTVYWRARTVNPTSTGNWVTASFRTTPSAPALPLVRWTQPLGVPMGGNSFVNASSTDSGITLRRKSVTSVQITSYGARWDVNVDRYSNMFIGIEEIRGYPWWIGNGLMAVAVNSQDGSYIFKGIWTDTSAARVDSLQAFLLGVPNGWYVGVAAMEFGKRNVTESFITTMEGLGATQFRSLQNGMSYAFLVRKGVGGTVQEVLNNDTARVSVAIPTLYPSSGWATSPVLRAPYRWREFRWNPQVTPGVTGVTASLVGIRPSGSRDTLLTVPAESTVVSLAGLNGLERHYDRFVLAARLTTSDASLTPVLPGWSVLEEPPADLGITLGSAGGDVLVPRGATLPVHATLVNLGYRTPDSTRVRAGVYNEVNVLRPYLQTMSGPLGVDSVRDLPVNLSTDLLAGRVAMEWSVEAADSSGDLYDGNNTAAFAFAVTGMPVAGVELFADGARLQDGDFVSASPRILIRPAVRASAAPTVVRRELWVDGQFRGAAGEDGLIVPVLSAGRHELRAIVQTLLANGGTDTLQTLTAVSVSEALGIHDLLNYPNPCTSTTEFTFALAGAVPPERTVVRVFTLAGRKIREIILGAGETRIGFNRIPWDCHDQDGDEIANGVYFYQVQVTAAEKTETAIGKLVRMR